eukprot:SAG31_NODE_39248_length_289_cov_2.510526_1_plen_77_part_10
MASAAQFEQDQSAVVKVCATILFSCVERALPRSVSPFPPPPRPPPRADSPGPSPPKAFADRVNAAADPAAAAVVQVR